MFLLIILLALSATTPATAGTVDLSNCETIYVPHAALGEGASAQPEPARIPAGEYVEVANYGSQPGPTGRLESALCGHSTSAPINWTLLSLASAGVLLVLAFAFVSGVAYASRTTSASKQRIPFDKY